MSSNKHEENEPSDLHHKKPSPEAGADSSSKKLKIIHGLDLPKKQEIVLLENKPELVGVAYNANMPWYKEFEALPYEKKFDFVGFPPGGPMRSIRVTDNGPQILAECAAVACIEYNNETGLDYQLTRLVKALAGKVHGEPIYLTFLAHDAQTSTAKTFRCVCEYTWEGASILSKSVSDE